MHDFVSPNLSKPTLGLGSLRNTRNPAKAFCPDIPPHPRGVSDAPPKGSIDFDKFIFDRNDPEHVEYARNDVRDLNTHGPGDTQVCGDLVRPDAAAQEPPSKPHHPRADARLPFAAITGTVSPFPVSWTTPEERKAALGRWVARIAREVASPYQTKSERDAAEQFARSHRLSIANCFQRKLCRTDVVEALIELYELSKADDPFHRVSERVPGDHSELDPALDSV
jgi:hypothetical protein